MVNCDSGSGFLRSNLDLVPCPVRAAEQIPFLDSSDFCDWSGCSPMGSDALGYLWPGFVVTLDARRTSGWSNRWQDVMALARAA